MSSDVYECKPLVAGSDLVTLSGRTVTAIAGVTSVGTVTVKVSFPAYAPLISQTVSVSFVQLASLSATSFPYPSYSGSTSSQKSVLNLVACTNTYQWTRLSSTGTLSDNSNYDLSSYTTFTSLSTGTVQTTGVFAKVGWCKLKR